MKPQVIALEEHYLDPEVARHFNEAGPEARDAQLRERLHDVGELRIREMDEVGIDIQVLSHSAPATQRFDAETAPAIARAANDRLRERVRAANGRFEAFAALPTANPRAAADELERAVTKLGFKGAMIHGLTNGHFIDERQFWPIFERAKALDVPIYIHPAVPHPAVVEAYYRDYLKEFPGLLTAAWGFTVETATQGIRLVLSGVFDAYPGLKIIMGHLGDLSPALLDHDERQFLNAGAALQRDGDGRRSHSLFGRLSLRAQPAWRAMDGACATRTRGPREDAERQRKTPAEALIRIPSGM